MISESRLDATRASYDTVAADYADLLRDELAARPWDRAMLTAYAEVVSGTVADVGCGPGRITAHLAGLGLSTFGVDLSPGMIEVARRAHPGLRFEVGTMTDLDVADGELGGVVSWYSLVHTPPEQLPTAFAEFHRVLASGGHLLIAFKVGDERRELTHAYGHDVSLDVYWVPMDLVADLVTGAGLVEQARLVRAAGRNEKSAPGFLLARKA